MSYFTTLRFARLGLGGLGGAAAKKSVACLAALSLMFATGCAPKNWNTEEDGAYDPFEGVNRLTFKFNSGIDAVLVRPVASSYSAIYQPARESVGNFFNNLSEPANMVNNGLQLNGDGVYKSFSRFVFNTTIGVGGLFDPAAKHMGLESHETDMGLTLRHYGMRDTFYVVLPLFGPSGVADTLGVIGDAPMNPVAYIDNDTVRYSLIGVNAINTRAELLEFTDLVDEVALDKYIFVRDAYEENRLSKVPPSDEEN